MQISVESIKELRGLTGAGIMDSKNALQASNGDIAKAEEILREKGMASAMKKSARATNEGLVESYIHSGGRIGAIVEANCETDFVARTDDFKALAHDIAMHVAASILRASPSLAVAVLTGLVSAAIYVAALLALLSPFMVSMLLFLLGSGLFAEFAMKTMAHTRDMLAPYRRVA